VQRVLVGGISGAGKSTMARALGRRLDLPYVEMDALFHGPGWVPREEFVDDVRRVAAGERWVVDSDGYSVVRDALWTRADTLIWLDLPRWQVMSRVLRRSFLRGILRSELWNGNRESLLGWRNPEHPVQWAWRAHGDRRATIGGRLTDPRWAHLRVVHLSSAADARQWMRDLARSLS
jgi:adenylate kinase family enzyme